MTFIRIPLVAVAVLLGLAQAGALTAQSCPVAPEDFRTELESFVEDLEGLYLPLDDWDPSLSPGLQPVVEELDRLVGTLTTERLVEVCDVFTRYPELRDTPAMVAGVLPSLPPLEGLNGSCLALSREAYLALFVVTEILKAAEVVAEAVCSATACPVYAGVVVCAPTDPSCGIVCPATVGVLRVLRLISESFLIEDNHCGLVNHYAVAEAFAERTDSTLVAFEAALRSDVIPRLDTPVSTRASQTSLDLLQTTLTGGFAAVDGSLGGILLELAAQADDREDFQQLDLRLRIEASLQDGEGGAISSLQLPEVLGGRLELVREIVADAILMNEAIGDDMTRALLHFAEGDHRLNQQNYQAAWSAYRKAYQTAAGDNDSITD